MGGEEVSFVIEMELFHVASGCMLQAGDGSRIDEEANDTRPAGGRAAMDASTVFVRKVTRRKTAT